MDDPKRSRKAPCNSSWLRKDQVSKANEASQNQNHACLCWWMCCWRSRWIFLLTPPTPTPGLCVGMYSTCEVHAKYALMQDPDAPRHHYRPTFREAEGSKWPKFNDIFEPKKKFNDSAPSIAGALNLLMNKNQAKAEVRCGELFLWNSFNVKVFRLLWESHSPCLLVSHRNTQRNFLSECISVLWVNLWMILPKIFEKGVSIGVSMVGWTSNVPYLFTCSQFQANCYFIFTCSCGPGFFVTKWRNRQTPALRHFLILWFLWHFDTLP